MSAKTPTERVASITDQLLPDNRWRCVEALFLLGMLIESVETVAIVDGSLGVEANPIAKTLLPHVGLSGHAVLSVLAVAVVIETLRFVERACGWSRVTWAWGVIATAGIWVVAASNTWAMLQNGFALSVPAEAYLEATPAVVVAPLAYFRRELVTTGKLLKTHLHKNIGYPVATERRRRAIVTSATCLLLVTSVLSGVVQFPADGNGNRAAIESVSAASGDVEWDISVGAPSQIQTGPDGTYIYAINDTTQPSLLKIYAKNGTIESKKDSSHIEDGSGLAISNDGSKVYISNSTNVYAHKTSDLSQTWKSSSYSIDNSLNTNPIDVGPNGGVYAITDNSPTTVIKLDKSDGSQNISTETPNSAYVGEIEPSAKSNIVYYFNINYKVVKYNMSSDSVLWRSPALSGSTMHAVIDKKKGSDGKWAGNGIVVSVQNGKTHSIDNNGDLSWSSKHGTDSDIESGYNGYNYLANDTADIIKRDSNGNIQKKISTGSTPNTVAISSDNTQLFSVGPDGNDIVAYDSGEPAVGSGAAAACESGSDLCLTVEDQNSQPVSNASVIAYGVNTSAVDDAEDRAEELRDLANHSPDEGEFFENTISDTGIRMDKQQLKNYYDSVESGNTEYGIVKPHSADQWDTRGSQWGFQGNLVFGTYPGSMPGVFAYDTSGDSSYEEPPVVASYWSISEEELSGQWNLFPPYFFDDNSIGRPPISYAAYKSAAEVELQRTTSNAVFESETFTTDEEYELRDCLIGDQLCNTETVNAHNLGNLPPGHYRMKPEGANQMWVSFTVSPDSDEGPSSSLLNKNLTDEAGDLTDNAQELQNKIDNGTYERKVVTTDANGTASLDWSNSDIETVGAQAMKVDGAALDNKADTDTTFSEMQNIARGNPEASSVNYREFENQSGSYYPGDVFMATPSTYEIPNRDATLTGHRLSGKALAKMTDAKNISDLIEKWQDMTPAAGIPDTPGNISDLRDRAYNLCSGAANETSLQLPNECANVVETPSGDRADGLSNMSRTDLNSAIAAAEALLETLPGDSDACAITAEGCEDGSGDAEPVPDGFDLCEFVAEPDQWDACTDGGSGGGGDDEGDGDGGIGDPICDRLPGLDICQEDGGDDDDAHYENNTWSGVFDMGAELELEDVTVSAVFSNGTRYPVRHVTNDGHWLIRDRAGPRDQVIINDYPAGDGSVSFQVTALPGNACKGINCSNSRLIRRGDRAISPDYSGRLPQIQAIKVDSLRPGPGENVQVEIKGEGAETLNVTDITATGPNSKSLPAQSQGQRKASVQTAGTPGPHRIAVGLEKNGQTFEANFGLPVGSASTSMPPTIRAHVGPLGTIPVVGNGYESGNLDVDGNTIEVAGIVAQDADAPSETHVELGDLKAGAEATTEIQLLRGEVAQTQIRQSAIVTTHHSTEFPDGTLVYRNGEEPITRAGTEYGRVTLSNTNNSAITETYTDDDGSVAIETNTDPGTLDRLFFSLRESGVPVPAAPDVPVIGAITPPTGVGA